jgi:hypothetical protein
MGRWLDFERQMRSRHNGDRRIDVDPRWSGLLIDTLVETDAREKGFVFSSALPIPTQRSRAIEFSIVVWSCAVIAVSVGCRSRAHNDLYRQKMASEIRVLEDQLYDADYQNRVLQDNIQRLREQALEAESGVRQDPAPVGRPEVNPLPSTPPAAESDPDEMFEPPFIEEGELADPSELSGAVSPDDGDPLGAGLVPPSEPEPPGKDDLELPEVFPGELLPPAGDGDGESPPGQIPLPQSVQAATAPFPESIRIHRGLSGGHQFDEDDQIDGMYLVINAIDKLGKTVDLSSYDIDAELTVVALDPTLEADVARIGRWNFTAQEVLELIRDDPTSGLHVPLRWQDVRPATDEVIVHVRLRADEDEMRCDEKLIVGAAAAMAKWTPRGD